VTCDRDCVYVNQVDRADIRVMAANAYAVAAAEAREVSVNWQDYFE